MQRPVHPVRCIPGRVVLLPCERDGGGEQQALVGSGVEFGCDAIQIFNQSPRAWRPTPYGDEDKASAVYDDVRALMPDDIAESVHWIASLPAHVNVNTIELMPVAQTFGPMRIHRG